MENQPENNGFHRRHFFCALNESAIATGVAVGVGIGLAINNIALGIALGIALYSGEDFARRRRGC